MTVKRMDNVGIVVEDIDAAVGFFTELGLDPSKLPPRDREKYWYTAIAQAQVDSDAATAAGNRLAEKLQEVGYVVGPPPGRGSS